MTSEKEILEKLHLDDLEAVAGGMDADRERSLYLQMKVWKLGGLTLDMIMEYLPKNKYSDEDIEYIKEHYDSIVINLD